MDHTIAIIVGWAISLVVTVVTLREQVKALARRVARLEVATDRLPRDYFPRSEADLALRNIERQTSETHNLLKAFVYAGGDHGVAIRAIEAAAAADSEAWLDDYVLNICPRFEGTVPWMYLDTVGLVTVADGNMLPNAAAACALPFRTAKGDLASKDAVAMEFARVKALPPAHLPRFYRNGDATLSLMSLDISSLLHQRCIEFLAQLRAMFPAFDSFHWRARQALLDMAFNLGIGRSATPQRRATGLHEFGHLLAALAATPPDFHAAAANCTRVGPGPDRNHWTEQQFLAAAGDPA